MSSNPYRYRDPNGRDRWGAEAIEPTLLEAVTIVASRIFPTSEFGAAGLVRVPLIFVPLLILSGDTPREVDKGGSATTTAATPPPDGDGEKKGDKQKKGKPERNVDQNKRVKDAAREAGLTGEQRRLLGEIIERDSRQGGADYTYQEIKAIAEEILGGRSHY